MSDNNDQFIDDAEPVPDDQLSKISQLGIDYVVTRNNIIKLKNDLDRQERQLKHLSEVVIPEAMQKVNMRSFGLENGFKLEVKPVIFVTLPKDKADEADAWLDANGHGGMVKFHLDIHLPKGTSQENISNLKRSIERFGYEYSENKSIHFQTLNKWAREMEEENETIPENIFKVFRGFKTEIKNG